MDIMADKRPIIRLLVPDEDGSLDSYEVGTGRVTAIIPYYENGEMAPVVWFKIMAGDMIWQRVNGRSVDTIIYDLKPTRDPLTCPTCEVELSDTILVGKLTCPKCSYIY